MSAHDAVKVCSAQQYRKSTAVFQVYVLETEGIPGWKYSGSHPYWRR